MTLFVLRKAEEGDLAAIAAIYEQAKARLRESGIDQWQQGTYPNIETAQQDLAEGNAYVICDEAGVVAATAYLACGVEPTYEWIFEGAWQRESGRYLFIHRVAVATAYLGKGLTQLFFTEAERIAKAEFASAIRCDTHRANVAMQTVLTRAGLQRCGVIYIEDGSERLAYEKLLS